jgi:hypothetical protein
MSEATTETPILSTADRYATVQRAHTLAMERLRELQTKSEFAVLTEGEVDEMVRLERQTANLGGVLERLHGEMLRERVELDIASVCERWSGLVEAKQEAYQGFAQALADLGAAFDAIVRVHRAQEEQILHLPEVLQRRLMFPSDMDLVRRISGRLPNPLGWGEILGRPIGLTRGQFNEVVDADPGARAIPERVIKGFLEGTR